tara:strand:+ start:2291 stop:4099 length:1809 start_codon:yes stop_codon:yes gene_type:complete
MKQSDLDKLIEQVIAEKTVIDLTNRLPSSGVDNEDEDEDVRNALDLPDRTKVKRPEKTGDDEYKYSASSVNRDMGFNQNTLSKKQIKYIAGLKDDDGEPDGAKRKGHFITDDDFKILFSKTDTAAVEVVKTLFTKVFKLDGTGGIGTKPEETLGKLINLYIGSKMQKDLDPNYQQLKDWVPGERVDLLAPVVQAALKKVGKVPEEFGWGMFPNPMKGSEVAPGTKGEDTVDRFQKVGSEQVNLDPMLAGIFKEFEGGSINDRFKQLEEFASIFKGETDETSIQAGLQSWMSKNKKNQFQLMNYAYAVAMIADESKKQSSSNAGAFLEGYLNYFIGAPSVGGLSAATDNIAKLLNSGALVYTSAKFYTGGTKVPQDGLNLAKEAENQSVYYIIASKQAETGGDVKGASYDKIDFHMVEIISNNKATNKKNPWGLSQVNLGPNLRQQGTPLVVRKGTGSNESKAIISYKNKDPMFTIYTLPAKLAGEIIENKQTFDNIFIKSVRNSTEEALAVVKSISANLSSIQELDYKTKKLSGDVGTNSAGQALLKNKTAIMARFAQLQGDLKSGYDTIFAAVEEDTGPVSESNLSLDSLIEAIIKQKLLK